MKQKKLILLGGIRYLLPLIEAAHKQRMYAITADIKTIAENMVEIVA